MWYRSDLKERGKRTFKRFYWKCILVIVISALVGGGFNSELNLTRNILTPSNNQYNYNSDYNQYPNDIYIDDTYNDMEDEIYNSLTTVFAAFIGVGLIITIIVFILKLVVTYPIMIGKNNYFMGIRKEEQSLETLIIIYKSGRLKETIITMFCKELFQFLWSLLFIIPGIVKSYEYRMIPYILCENPNIDRKRAFQMSKDMMYGNKWKTFVLDLSFIGWYILSAITLGIVGVFYAAPYIESTNAELYAYLREDALVNNKAKPSELIGF